MILLLALIVLVIVLVGYGHYSNKGTVVRFVNLSSNAISTIRIDVSGRFCEAKEVGINGELTCQFTDLSDSEYEVNIELTDGTQISNELGYVTGGINFNDVIEFNSDLKLGLKTNE